MKKVSLRRERLVQCSIVLTLISARGVAASGQIVAIPLTTTQVEGVWDAEGITITGIVDGIPIKQDVTVRTM